jgi:polysaccharide deacetylase family protein (PEP-CTERM system associated)
MKKHSNNRTTNLFSIDVEDFFHGKAFRYMSREQWDAQPGRVEQNTLRILELLEKSDNKATFFYLGWVAKKYPQLVKQTMAAGHEIASHGYHHLYNPDSPEILYEDMKTAKDTIEEITGQKVLGYRAPCFINYRTREYFFDILHKAGYTYDSSLYPSYHNWYEWTEETRVVHHIEPGIIEVPMSSLNRWGMELPMGGGGYLRLLPYTYFQRGISALNDRGQFANIYLHPYDIDPDNPTPKGSLVTKIRRKLQLGNTDKKLEKLLNRFKFEPIHSTLSTQSNG